MGLGKLPNKKPARPASGAEAKSLEESVSTSSELHTSKQQKAVIRAQCQHLTSGVKSMNVLEALAVVAVLWAYWSTPVPRVWLVSWTVAVLGLVAAAVAAGFIPVPQSVLAPAEVSASDPATVASPLDGVVQAIEVQPNQRVEAGDLLLTLDPTNLQAEVAVARRTLEIAEAELRRARQGAFNDRDAGAQIALLEARARLRQAELEYAEQRLARVEVRAERPGIVLFTRADDWIGRPVQTGQRIMTIADPSRAEIRVELPVGEAIRLEPGAPVQLFLDARPLEPVAGRMTSLSYTAEQTPGGILAYELKARLDQKAGEALPRVGLRGTAKVYGADVPLAFYLFRRPLAALRQHTGF